MRTTPASPSPSHPLPAAAAQERTSSNPFVTPRHAARGAHVVRNLAPTLELLEALGHAAILLDGQGGIVAETTAFGALVAEHAEAAAARAAAPRLLVVEALAERRARALERERVPRLLSLPIGGLELELRLLTSMVELARGAAAVVVVALRPRTASREEFLAAHYRLTSREVPVALLLGQGLSVQCIADHLAISVHTVRRHGESVYRKLGVRSRAALAAAVTRVTMLAGVPRSG